MAQINHKCHKCAVVSKRDGEYVWYKCIV